MLHHSLKTWAQVQTTELLEVSASIQMSHSVFQRVFGGFLGEGENKEQKLYLKPLFKKVAYVEVTGGKVFQWLL